jgi:hypothetical protein
MECMKTQRHPWRKPVLSLLAVIAVVALGSQAAVAGLHLACHGGVDPLDPVHACAVCAHFWLSPAAPVAVTELPPPASVTALLPPTEPLSSATVLPHARVRAPPAVVS